MYRDKKTGIYYVSVTDPSGKRTRRPTGTRDQKLAKEIATKWAVEAIRVGKLGELPRWTFDQVMAWWLVQISSKSRSDYNNRSAVGVLRPHFRGKVIVDLTHVDFDAFIKARRAEGVTDKTIARNLSVLSGALTAAADDPEFRGIPNPVKGFIPKVDPHDHRIRWEEKSVVKDLAEACTDAVMTDWVMTAAYSGMRLSEMRCLEWRRVDLNRNLVHLTPAHQKSKRHGVVVLNQTARAHLMNRKRETAERFPGCPYVFWHEDEGEAKAVTKDWVEYRFEKACGVMKLEDFRLHDLRHCFCTWAALAGVGMLELKQLARHQDIRTTEKYIHLAAEHLRNAAAAVDGQYFVSPDAQDVELDRLTA